jgi:hypothetical protein
MAAFPVCGPHAPWEVHDLALAGERERELQAGHRAVGAYRGRIASRKNLFQNAPPRGFVESQFSQGSMISCASTE